MAGQHLTKLRMAAAACDRTRGATAVPSATRPRPLTLSRGGIRSQGVNGSLRHRSVELSLRSQPTPLCSAPSAASPPTSGSLLPSGLPRHRERRRPGTISVVWAVPPVFQAYSTGTLAAAVGAVCLGRPRHGGCRTRQQAAHPSAGLPGEYGCALQTFAQYRAFAPAQMRPRSDIARTSFFRRSLGF